MFHAVYRSARTITVTETEPAQPLRHPAVASVVVGLSNGAQVDAAIERLQTPIKDEVWTRLDAVVEGGQ